MPARDELPLALRVPLLLGVALLALAPRLAEASVPRASALERVDVAALRAVESGAPVADSGFSLFVGDELGRGDAVDVATPRLGLALPSLELASRERPRGFALHLGEPLLLANPPPALEYDEPKTRIRAFDFLGATFIGVERGVSIELRPACERFGCGSASGIGSWLSEDPLGDVDSPNLYAYVGWRPHERTDPLGLQAQPLPLPPPEAVPFVPGEQTSPWEQPDVSTRDLAPVAPPESWIAFKSAIERAKAQRRGAGARALGGRTADELTEQEKKDFLEHRRRMRTDPQYRAEAERIAEALTKTKQYPPLPVPASAGGGEGGDPPGTFRDAQGKLRDAKTGRFVEDPANPRSPFTFNDAQRRAAWRQIAQDPNSPLTPEQRAEVEARGWRGPQRINPVTGQMETMELSHEPVPLREGGTEVVPRWPDEHAAVDPYRQLPKNP